METQNDEISLIPVKITKNNITKITIETFLKDIDYDKKYTLNELKILLTKAFKSIKQKKNTNTTKKEPSKYNMFVKEVMVRLKKENPDMSNKETLKLAASEWRKEKEKEKEKETNK